jgi:hypothetical protein
MTFRPDTLALLICGISDVKRSFLRTSDISNNYEYDHSINQHCHFFVFIRWEEA